MVMEEHTGMASGSALRPMVELNLWARYVTTDETYIAYIIMFSFIADGLTFVYPAPAAVEAVDSLPAVASVAMTVLFPIFASYKALHTSDPALLAPWLIYFVVLSSFAVVENTFDFILSWVPFYSWIRFFAHLYLILPGSQGATFLYQEYMEPFLYHHEKDIDEIITQAHARGKAAGLAYLAQAIEWFKVTVLGFPPSKPGQPPAAGQTYAQNLMSRFQMPSARGPNDLYGLVNQALSGASALYTGNQTAQAADISRNANLVPETIRSNVDRANYVASQRQRLQTLLQAFDQEQENIQTAQSSGKKYHDSSHHSSPNLSRNRSEPEFDRIERDDLPGGERPPYPITPPVLGRRSSSGWMPWNWQKQGMPSDDPLAYGREPGESRDKGRSTGFDLGDR